MNEWRTEISLRRLDQTRQTGQEFQKKAKEKKSFDFSALSNQLKLSSQIYFTISCHCESTLLQFLLCSVSLEPPLDNKDRLRWMNTKDASGPQATKPFEKFNLITHIIFVSVFVHLTLSIFQNA